MVEEKVMNLVQSTSAKNFKDLQRLAHTECPQYITLERHLKRILCLLSSKDWSKKDLIFYKEFCTLHKIPIELTPPLLKHSTSTFERPSFSEYVTNALHVARNTLQLPPFYGKVPHLIPSQLCFEQLNYRKNIDPAYNEKQTYFIKDLVLTPHATAYVQDLDCVLDWFSVYRREKQDRTHLCEFYQLQYRKLYDGEDPLKELVKDLTYILYCLGLNPENVSFRPSPFLYVDPGLQIIYNGLQVGGCGIMNTKNAIYLAAGIGLERCYMLKYKLSTMGQVYPLRL